MLKSMLELDNSVWRIYSENETLLAWNVLQTDHQHTSQQALQWDVAGYKKGPDTRKNQVNEDQNVEA